MSLFPAFQRPTVRVPGLLGDSDVDGAVRAASWDLVLVRVGDTTGRTILAVLPLAATQEDTLLPPAGTPVVLVFDGGDALGLPYVDVDFLP
jgi:hypothetical protein